jgi:putative phage-type endonuclease
MTYRVINLQQGSSPWHEFRRSHLGASEIPAVMGESPYMTAYELYCLKVGLTEPIDQTDAMRKGHEMEPIIRAYFEQETGIALMPQVIESVEMPWLSASLDGISLDGDVFVEIKFNNKMNHQLCLNGEIPYHHFLQMQMQWGVLGHEAHCKGYYVSHHAGENIIVEIKPDIRIWNEIIEKGKEFWDHVQHKNPPALTDKDYPVIDSSELIADADQFSNNLDLIKQLEKQNDLIRKKIIAEVGRNAVIGDMRLSEVERKGAVQYENIPELQGIDLEPYRKESTKYWTLR